MRLPVRLFQLDRGVAATIFAAAFIFAQLLAVGHAAEFAPHAEECAVCLVASSQDDVDDPVSPLGAATVRLAVGSVLEPASTSSPQRFWRERAPPRGPPSF
ncbi:MAG: hypothetical protein AAFY22_03700 [Pseudomonadota bacterium]